MNHDSLNLQVVLPGLPSVNQLGHRDQQALRQMVEQFSVACCLIRQRGVTPSILETGSGLSTEVFARLTSPESGGGVLSQSTSGGKLQSRPTHDRHSRVPS